MIIGEQVSKSFHLLSSIESSEKDGFPLEGGAHLKCIQDGLHLEGGAHLNLGVYKLC